MKEMSKKLVDLLNSYIDAQPAVPEVEGWLYQRILRIIKKRDGGSALEKIENGSLLVSRDQYFNIIVCNEEGKPCYDLNYYSTKPHLGLLRKIGPEVFSPEVAEKIPKKLSTITNCSENYITTYTLDKIYSSRVIFSRVGREQEYDAKLL